MDKSGQAITECSRELWGIPDRHLIPVSAVYQELTEWKRENGMIATLYLTDSSVRNDAGRTPQILVRG
jgi:hypothetical protein